MYTENGFMVYVSTGFMEGKLMQFATDEEYYEWLEAQNTE